MKRKIKPSWPYMLLIMKCYTQPFLPSPARGARLSRVAEGRPTFQADLSGRTFWPDLQAGTRPERPLIKDVIRLLNNIISRLYTITVN